MFSLFENGWFHRNLFAKEELVAAVTKLSSVPYVAQSLNADSLNRLIIKSVSDFVFPDFLKLTIGSKYNHYESPTHSLVRMSSTVSNIDTTKKTLSNIFDKSKNRNHLDKLSRFSIEVNLFFENAPISIFYITFPQDRSTGADAPNQELLTQSSHRTTEF